MAPTIARIGVAYCFRYAEKESKQPCKTDKSSRQERLDVTLFIVDGEKKLVFTGMVERTSSFPGQLESSIVKLP